MTIDDFDEDDVLYWPDTVQAVGLFCEMDTQWRVGMGGTVGLDYGPLFHRMDRMGLEKAEFDSLFRDIQVMEAAALEEIHRR